MLTESCLLHPLLETRSHMTVKTRLTEDNFKLCKGKHLPVGKVELSSVNRVDPSCSHPINNELNYFCFFQDNFTHYSDA